MSNLSFNQDAVYQFHDGSMFLQGPRGLIDSVHRRDQTTFDRFKLLKRQDWDELEFNLLSSREDFMRYPAEGEMMKRNIGWQWSGDSTAANSLIPMMAPFQPNSDAWLWICRQGDNENLHALSYSECVKISVPDGIQEIKRIHEDYETMKRISYVTEVFDHVIRIGARMTLGDISYTSDEASDALMLALGAILIMERCQFMPSFGNTAALAASQKFMSIGDTVRKIAVDEWGTHIPQVKYFIHHELQTPQRRESLRRVKHTLTHLLEEIIRNEVIWNEHQFQLGGEQLGFTQAMGEDYAYYAATDVATHMGLKPNIRQVTKNPLPLMDSFLDLNRERKASMEAKGGNYQTVFATREAGQMSFDLTGLD